MRIQLSDHFTYKRLLRFVAPSIIMMICTSVYSIIDGLFVSNFVGKTQFAAVNLIFPVLMAMSTVGFMLGTGGSAIVSMALGMEQREKANRDFSLLIYTGIVLGMFFAITGFIFMPTIASALGATGELLHYTIIYGRILSVGQAAFILQNMFQSFFPVAEKPELSLKVSVSAGLTNFFLDFLFIVVFQWGLAGAAAATVMGQIVGGIVPLIYFIRKNNSLLQLTGTKFDGRVLLKACTNGSSEMLTNLSTSIVNMLYNYQLMKIAGENGLAAYGVIMYIYFIFAAIFIGYSIGGSPIISYHYGAGNYDELKNLFKKSLIIIGIAGITLTVLAELLALPLTKIYVSYDAELLEMTCRGFRLYSLAFLVGGFNSFSSSFFTALGDGGVSAAISFLRTLVFQVSVILILPVFLGLDGIWLAIGAADLLALGVTVTFFLVKRRKYHYA
ncbi:MAG: MATE family efflux transporter [Eubacteriales bacterium]|nr:MATE family efflux transporter [Eubacteriales bacterium]